MQCIFILAKTKIKIIDVIFASQLPSGNYIRFPNKDIQLLMSGRKSDAKRSVDGDSVDRAFIHPFNSAPVTPEHDDDILVAPFLSNKCLSFSVPSKYQRDRF